MRPSPSKWRFVRRSAGVAAVVLAITWGMSMCFHVSWEGTGGCRVALEFGTLAIVSPTPDPGMLWGAGWTLVLAPGVLWWFDGGADPSGWLVVIPL